MSSTSSPSSSQSSSSSSSPSQSSSSPSTELKDPEVVGSLFSFSPKLLEPFMGLKSIDHADDPWLNRPYDLHQPIFTGGGTYEAYMRNIRQRRGVKTQPTMKTRTTAKIKANPKSNKTKSNSKKTAQSKMNSPPKEGNIMTADMLDRLLNMRNQFEKNYPTFYKSMMEKQRTESHRKVSIRPPIIPTVIAHTNINLRENNEKRSA